MGIAELRLSVPVARPPEAVWAAATDWPRQGEWMLGTEVHLLRGDGGEGSEVAAFTGFRGVGFLDHMRVVEWRPPRVCLVRHTGGLIVGDGGFEVLARGPSGATFVWWERLVLPPGAGLVWPLVRPVFGWGLRRSLERFASWCERGTDGGERG